MTDSEVKKLNEMADYFDKIGSKENASLLRKLLHKGAINTDPNLKVGGKEAGGATSTWTGKITIRTEFLEGPVESLVILMAHELDHSRRISEANFFPKIWQATFGRGSFEKSGEEAGEEAYKLMEKWRLEQKQKK